MAVDLGSMDDAGLSKLIEDIQALLVQRQAEREAQQADVDVSILDAVAKLDALLGPEEPTAPGLESIREVRMFSQGDMHENAGLGLELAFLALQLLTETTRDIALSYSRGR